MLKKKQSESRRVYGRIGENSRIKLEEDDFARVQFENLLKKNLKMPMSVFHL